MDTSEISLRQYARILARGLPVLVLLPIVAGAAAYFLADELNQPRYTAEAQVLVNSPAESLADPAFVRSAESIVPTYLDVASSDAFFEEMAQTGKIPFTAEEAADKVEVDAAAGSLLISVEAHGSTDQEAVDLANAIAAGLTARGQPSVPGPGATSDVRQLRSEIQTLGDRMEMGRAEVDRLTAEYLGTPDSDTDARATLAQQIAVAQGNVRMWRSSYESSLDSLNRLSELVSLSFVAPAASADLDPKISSGTAAIWAAVAGLMLAVGLVFLFHYLDDRLRTVDDVAKGLGLPVLGEVHSEPPLPAALSGEPAKEYQRLYARLDSWRKGRPSLVLAVVSSVGSGDSQIAERLARTAASAGDSVSLISDRASSELSSGGRTRTGGIATNRPPPSQDVRQPLMATIVPGLSLFSPGLVAPEVNKSPTVSGFKQLLSKIAGRPGLVIIDAPSLTTEALSMVMAAASDGCVLVVETGRTRQPVAREALSALESLGSPVLGAIMTEGKYRRGRGQKAGEAARVAPSTDREVRESQSPMKGVAR